MAENLDIRNCCRLCLSTKLTFNIHTSDKYTNSEIPPLEELIKELTTVEIEKESCDPNISNNICFSCNYLIIKLYTFRQQSIASDKKFREAVDILKKNKPIKRKHSLVRTAESKTLEFDDSLVSLYARSLLRGTFEELKPTDVGSDSEIDNFTNGPLDLQEKLSVHPSVAQIIEDNPKIIIPEEVINFNYNCHVIVQSFQQLLREALSKHSKIRSKSSENNDSTNKICSNIVSAPTLERVDSNNDIDDDLCSKSVTSTTSSFDVGNYPISKNVVQCLLCTRKFTDEFMLKHHSEYCHVKKNEAIVLVEQLNCPKRYKSQYLRTIKLLDDTRIRLYYKKLRKDVQVPQAIEKKNKVTRTSSSLNHIPRKIISPPATDPKITFKTLNLTECNEFLQKLISDTNCQKDPNRSDNSSDTSKQTPKAVEIPDVMTVVPSTTFKDVGTPEQLQACASNADNLIQTPQVTTSSSIPRKCLYNYESHRQKMLKSSVISSENKCEEISNVGSKIPLCQEYLPVNRPPNSCSISSTLVNEPIPVVEKSAVTCVSETLTYSNINVSKEMLQPNFYVDKTLESGGASQIQPSENSVLEKANGNSLSLTTSQSNLKRKSDKELISCKKRIKTVKNNVQPVFKTIQGTDNVLQKFYVSQKIIEILLQKDLNSSNYNEISTAFINCSITQYLRKYPRYFNLLEQIVAIRDIPVVYNVSSEKNIIFEFIKSTHTEPSGNSCTVATSSINWNNTVILQDLTPKESVEYAEVSCKLQKKQQQILVPVSNWKKQATQLEVTRLERNDQENNLKVTKLDHLVEPINLFIPITTSSLTNVAFNPTKAYLQPEKQIKKVVCKRPLLFSGDKIPIQYVSKNVPILPKPNVTKFATLSSYNNVSTANGGQAVIYPLPNNNKQMATGVIEIDDDNDVGTPKVCNNIDINNANSNGDMGSLKIISVMSLNERYNDSIKPNSETSQQFSVNATKVVEKTGDETKTVKTSNISVLSPTRINMLVAKKRQV